MENNMINIIENAIKTKNFSNFKNEIELIKLFQTSINDNLQLFNQTTKIDISKNNGRVIDKEIINNIFNKYLNETPLINSKNDILMSNNNLLKYNIYTNKGLILVVFDGNPYILIEMIILGLLTHNPMIFSYEGYNLGTNGLIITLIESILEKQQYPNKMFQHVFNISLEDLFKNFKSIDETIIIGEHSLQIKTLKECTTHNIVSGYKNYDLYIEDDKNIDFIYKILEQNLNINLYINEELSLDIDDYISVSDIEEAITMINNNGSGYSASIFTSNTDNASLFVKNIESKNVLINTSPTIINELDITQKDLINEKTIVVPNLYEISDTIEIQN